MLECIQGSVPNSLFNLIFRYKNVERQPWVAPCNVKEVGNLMADLKSRGMDLAAFEARELFQIIRGRTLWCAEKAQIAS